MNNTEQIIGDWRREKVLGSGSYGEVALWLNGKSKERVAVKRCPCIVNDPPERKEKIQIRWKKELKFMLEMEDFPHIVRAAAVDKDFINALNKSGSSILPVLVMEYCDGGDVRSLLHDVKNANGLPEYEVKNLLNSLCKAIRYLHSHHITHRDLKPENIVIKKDRDVNIYKVTDFGYAKEMWSTNDNSQVGSVGYFAPEVLLNGKYSPTVDYWSIGIIAFEVICGCRPFVPHQTIMKWVELVRKKSMSTIAITEIKDDEFKEHERIFDENQISSCFKQRVEQFLPIALDFNPKRGRDDIRQPVHILNEYFFNKLEAVLNVKILTVFYINTCMNLSYEVTEKTTFDELLVMIEADIKIPHQELYLIFRPDHEIGNFNILKPTDLILEDIEGPMVFVIRNSFDKTVTVSDPYLSAMIRELLTNTSEVKTHYLLEYARHVLFMAQSENRKCVACFSGLRYYALSLNDSIVKHQRNMITIKSALHHLLGTFSSYETMLKLFQEKARNQNIPGSLCADYINQTDSIYEKHKYHVENVKNTIRKLETKFNTMLQGSNDVLLENLLREAEKDFLDVQSAEEYYKHLRADLSKEKSAKLWPKQKYEEIANLVYNIYSKRNVLESAECKAIQETLCKIHEEFTCLRKTKIYDELKKLEHEIKQANSTQFDFLWDIMLKSAPEMQKNKSSDLDLNHFKSLSLNDAKQNVVHLCPMSINELIATSIRYEQENDVKSLIEESDEISLALDHQMQDFEVMLESDEEGSSIS